MKPVTTITINQWHIKQNAEEGTDLPTICVNVYEFYRVKTKACGAGIEVEWGPRLCDTTHFHDLNIPAGRVIYDPVNKTPCGASCWVHVESNVLLRSKIQYDFTKDFGETME